MVKTNYFKDTFDSSKKYQDSLPNWVWDIRDPAIRRVDASGWPTLNDEEWKYTKVDPIIETLFDIPKERQSVSREMFDSYIGKGDIVIAFVDGTWPITYDNNIPDSITVLSMKEAILESVEARKILSLGDKVNRNIFSDLNTAFINNGVYIESRGIGDANSTVHIVYLNTASDRPFAVFPRNIVIVEKGARLNLIESYISFDNKTYFTNTLTEVFVKEGGVLNHTKIESESQSSYHVGETTFFADKGAEIRSFNFNSGASLARNNINVVIKGSDADITLNGLYLGSGKQHIDNHISVDHRVERSKSAEYYKGILKDKSQAVFNGKVMIRPNASKSDARQINRNLLLSKDAQINTMPQLEIDNDDVKASHGAAISQLNEDEILYLKSRGVSGQIAEKLLCRGFAEDVLYKSKIDYSRDKINFFMERYFKNAK